MIVNIKCNPFDFKGQSRKCDLFHGYYGHVLNGPQKYEFTANVACL